MKFKTGAKARFFAVFWMLLVCYAASPLFAQNNAGEEEGGAASFEEAEAEMRKITVEEAVNLALKNNLSLKSSALTLDKKRRPSDYSWNQFLPTLGLTGGLAMSNTKSSQTVLGPTGPSTIELSPWSAQFGASMQWQGLNYAMFEGIRVLKLDYATGKITFEKAKIQLERDVRKLYSSILLARANLDVQERSFALAEDQVLTATQNFRAGLSPELTLLQARLNRDNMTPAIDQQRNNIKVSMANLAVLMGLPFDSVYELENIGEIKFDMIFDTAELVRKAAGSKIDIQELRATIAYARSARNAQIYQIWTPTLALGWNYNPMRSSFDDFVDWRDGGRFSLSLSWTLNGFLPFTKEGQSIKDLNDNIRSLDINLAAAVQGTELEVYNTVFLIQQAKESAEAQIRTVELARRTYNDTLAAFSAGLRDFVEVQNIEQQLRQAELGVLQQRFAFLNGVIDLEYSIGAPFGSLMK